MPPGWLTSHVRTLMRTCNRITHPKPRTNVLEGKRRDRIRLAHWRMLSRLADKLDNRIATIARLLAMEGSEPSSIGQQAIPYDDAAECHCNGNWES